MKITELDRRSDEARRSDDRAEGVAHESLRARLGKAERQLRAQIKRNQVAWDQGFACAIDMFARGATLDDMRSRVRHPQAVPVLARGTRDLSEADTAPIALTEADTRQGSSLAGAPEPNPKSR